MNGNNRVNIENVLFEYKGKTFALSVSEKTFTALSEFSYDIECENSAPGGSSDCCYEDNSTCHKLENIQFKRFKTEEFVHDYLDSLDGDTNEFPGLIEHITQLITEISIGKYCEGRSLELSVSLDTERDLHKYVTHLTELQELIVSKLLMPGLTNIRMANRHYKNL